MTGLEAYGIAMIAMITAVYAGMRLYRDEPVDNPLFYGACIVLAASIIQLVAGCIALASTNRPVDGATFVSYLITTVLITPAAVLWGISEKSRWGIGVVVVAMIVVAVLELRLLQLWTA